MVVRIKADGAVEDVSWAKMMMSDFVLHLATLRPEDNFFMYAILGTSRHTDASFSRTSSGNARTAILPLGAPLMHEMQVMPFELESGFSFYEIL
jgi:hypothetical protein